MNKLQLIPEQYSPRMVAPAYANIEMPGSLTFNTRRAHISEDENSVYIKIGVSIIILSKQTQSVKINIR